MWEPVLARSHSHIAKEAFQYYIGSTRQSLLQEGLQHNGELFCIVATTGQTETNVN